MLVTNKESRILDQITLKDALAKLSTKQRAVVALRMAGYTQQDCGEVVGLTKAAIWFIYWQAIREIRRMVGQDDA